MIWVILVLGIVWLMILAMSVRIVQEYERAVVFRLGRLTGVRGPGLILPIPFLETSTTVGLRTVTMAIPSQKIITKDNVSIDIAAVAYYQIVDPQKAVVAVEDVYSAGDGIRVGLISLLNDNSEEAKLLVSCL